MKKKFATLPSKLAAEIMIEETFGDLLVAGYTGTYSGLLGEFAVMDNVPLHDGKKIINLINKGTVLRRKAPGCETNWVKIGDVSNEEIHVTKLSAGIKQCDDDFFTGCMEDYRKQTPKFKKQLVEFFQIAIARDTAVNSYFGKVGRPEHAEGIWQWNSFDGIVEHYAKHIASGKLPGDQTINIAAVNTPQQAFDLIKSMYGKRNSLMRTMDKRGLAFYVNENIADLYEEYLSSLGTPSCCGVGYVQEGISTLKYKGIGIYVEPVWDPVLASLNGGNQANLAILCPRKTWTFGMNSKYGGGENNDTAFRLWYDEDEETWKAKYWLAHGTAVASPQNHVFAMTELEEYDPS